MFVDSDEDEEDDEAKQLRLSVLKNRNLSPEWYIQVSLHLSRKGSIPNALHLVQTFLQWLVHQTVAPRIEWLGQTEVGPDFTRAFRWIAR